NIERASDRATGSAEGAALESIVYEGYAPGGVSVMIEAATDNRNRTVSEIRAAFTRGGGKLGESGSVQWLFEQKGVIEIDTKGKDSDAIQLAAIDAGAEDVEVEPGLATVYTTPTSVERVRKALAPAVTKTGPAELAVPHTTMSRGRRQHDRGGTPARDLQGARRADPPPSALRPRRRASLLQQERPARDARLRSAWDRTALRRTGGARDRGIHTSRSEDVGDRKW